jgi:hypothetical protein
MGSRKKESRAQPQGLGGRIEAVAQPKTCSSSFLGVQAETGYLASQAAVLSQSATFAVRPKRLQQLRVSKER